MPIIPIVYKLMRKTLTPSAVKVIRQYMMTPTRFAKPPEAYKILTKVFKPSAVREVRDYILRIDSAKMAKKGMERVAEIRRRLRIK